MISLNSLIIRQLSRAALVLILSLGSVSLVYGQDLTSGRNITPSYDTNTVVATVYSFPPNYYVSELEYLYGSKNNITYREAKQALTTALFRSIEFNLKERFVSDFVQTLDTLRFTHSMQNSFILSGYKESNPPEVENKKIKKEGTPPMAVAKVPLKSNLDKGDVKTVRGEGALFIHRTFKEGVNFSSFVPNLEADTLYSNASTLVFLNGFNAKKETLPNYYDAKNLNYQILLELFYTLIDLESNQITHGSVREMVPASEERLSVIGGKYFDQLSKQLVLLIK
ncbi:MAG: hypothetical protein ACXITV_12535 [Luteibaculaceae bacterium]